MHAECRVENEWGKQMCQYFVIKHLINAFFLFGVEGGGYLCLVHFVASQFLS